MNEPTGRAGLPQDRLPDVKPPRSPASYAVFTPNIPAPRRRSSVPNDEPAWWEPGTVASLPDAPAWRQGSVVGDRLPTSTERAGVLTDRHSDLDDGELHRGHLASELRANRVVVPDVTPDRPVSRGEQRRAERERARRNRQETAAADTPAPAKDRTQARERAKERRAERRKSRNEEIERDWQDQGLD